MKEKKQMAAVAGLVLAVSLLAASLTAACLIHDQSRSQFQMLGTVCREILERQPQAEQAVMSALRECKGRPAEPLEGNILTAYGYRRSDFFQGSGTSAAGFVLAGFLAGGLLFTGTLLFWRRRELSRIRALTAELEQVHTGKGRILPAAGEDAFSGLQDEICKTVTELYQTREEALLARDHFAENLYNIAHQIKTPITSILLSLRMEPENPDGKTGRMAAEQREQIRRQLLRLTRLEESLLLLSRMEAGAFTLEKKEVDVFNLLELSAENLTELAREAQVEVVVPESGGMRIMADLEWTMEAVMNLLKNCIEHTPRGGRISCFYEQNPLYTQIRIQDTGSGFAREDLPHLFERFYRGRNAKGGIGIGLALARTIIESQNGTVSARNLPEGGACFEIHFYACHPVVTFP